jgi:hypothetical protein
VIKGTPLLGFADAFDASWGNPATPKPYLRVTPSRLGDALLPFRCPGCGAVLTQFSDPGSRSCYTDPQRGHRWCPACGLRILLDVGGMPLPAPLLPGAVVAPSKVTREGAVVMQDETPTEQPPLSMLGA